MIGAEVFFVVILLGGFLCRGNQIARQFIAANFNVVLGQLSGHKRQKRLGHFAMHQQRLGRIADAKSLALGIDGDGDRLIQIGVGVDVHVAVAREVLDDGHRGFCRYTANQPFTAAGDGQIDVFVEGEKLPDGFAVGR